LDMHHVRGGCKRRATYRSSEDDENGDDDSGKEEEQVVRVGNSIYFHCEVTRQTVLRLIKKLEEAAKDALASTHWPRDARIYLYIHSEGGDAFAGISARSHIANSPVEVVCIADAFVASAATFMLLASKHRVALRDSSILIHQLSTSFWGKFCDLKDEYRNSSMLMGKIKDIYLTSSSGKMSAKQLDELISKEIYLTETQCVDMGLVHEVWW